MIVRDIVKMKGSNIITIAPGGPLLLWREIGQSKPKRGERLGHRGDVPLAVSPQHGLLGGVDGENDFGTLRSSCPLHGQERNKRQFPALPRQGDDGRVSVARLLERCPLHY